MKKIILFLAIGCVMLLLPSTATAQDYRPMAVEEAHWVVYRFAPMDVITGAWEHYCHGDTTINQLTYKKIYRRDLDVPESYYSPRPFYPISSYTLVALIRDDIEAQKVYAIILDEDIHTACMLNEEVVLYEFPLNVGEQVDFCILNGTGIDPFVHEIYEYQLWGETVKAYRFISDIYSVSYYESIGSGNGPFEKIISPGIPYSEFYTLLRYYCLDCDDQFVVATEEHEAIQVNIKLTPNPAKETVRIQLTQPESITSFQICNLYGNVVHTQETNKAAEYALDISKLAAGVYLVYFYNQNHVLEVKKLLVTR